MKPLHRAREVDALRFTHRQETVKKDIERCFGVLQARFEVIRR